MTLNIVRKKKNSIWVFFQEHSRFTVQQEKGEGIYFNSSLPILPPASQAFRH